MQLLAWSPSPVQALAGGCLVAAGLLASLWLRRLRARDRAEELDRIVRAFARREDRASPRAMPIVPPAKRPAPWRLDAGAGSNFPEFFPGTIDIPKTPGAVPTLISVPCLDAHTDGDARGEADSLGRRHAAIWGMADSGLSAQAISNETGQPIGEVELILGLRRRAQAAPPESSKGPRP